MNKNDDSQSGTQFLSNLSSYAFNTETLPSHEEAKKILASEKIDTSKLKIWVNDQLRSARAKQKLTEAEKKRSKMVERFSAIRSRLSQGTEELRESVMAKLQILENSSPDLAQVYCRKFEETSDEDLPDLEAELLMLEKWNEETEK